MHPRANVWHRGLWPWLGVLGLIAAGGGSAACAADKPVLRLATTTSVGDSGLAPAILPDFERQNGCRVDVIAVGTGQALAIARRGDADVVIVHARKQEDEFLAAGHARQRHEIMYNDLVLVGRRTIRRKRAPGSPPRPHSAPSRRPVARSSAAATRAAPMPRSWRCGPLPG